MAAHSDHIRRDAEHAARNEISTVLGRFQRRMNEAAKAAIAVNIEDIDGEIDFTFGTELGRHVAQDAVREFLFDSPESVTPKPQLPKPQPK